MNNQIQFCDKDGILCDYTKYNLPDWLPELLLNTPKQQYTSMEPSSMYKGTLQSHQKEALGFAMSRPRTMLALDCGLGKTHIGMAYLVMHLPALVICPASLKASWIEHIHLYAPNSADQVDVVSYSSLKLYSREKVTRIKCIVADEAHYLKNESSIRSKLFHNIQKTCRNILLLTGTPAQRNMDLFNLLKILDGDKFKYFYHYNYAKKTGELYFADRYCIPEPVWIGGSKHGYKFTKNKNSSELALLCECYILRMKKTDVLRLPEIEVSSEVVGHTDRPDYYQSKYTEIEELRERKGNRVADRDLLSLCRESTMQKLPFISTPIKKWLDENPGSKCILFYHHTDVGNSLVQMMEPMGSSYIRIDGKTTMKKRCVELQRFRDDPQCRVGILSLCATSTGLNLQFCTQIFFTEMTFLSIHHTQAESRIHRIGQTRDVKVTYLILQGTTDIMVWRSLLSKRRAEKLLFDGDSSDDDIKSSCDDDMMILPI